VGAGTVDVNVEVAATGDAVVAAVAAGRDPAAVVLLGDFALQPMVRKTATIAGARAKDHEFCQRSLAPRPVTTECSR
jgi:hypothetical protein